MGMLTVVGLVVIAWLALAVLVLCICRIAAQGDGALVSDHASAPQSLVKHPIGAGLVAWEQAPDVDAALEGLVVRRERQRSGRVRSA